jgi:hypothetical protein
MFSDKITKIKRKTVECVKNKYLDAFNYTWYFCVGRENDRIECPEHQNLTAAPQLQ